MADDDDGPGPGTDEDVADEPRRDRGKDRNRFVRLGEQLTGLLDPESALRRGQGLVTGVTQATKDELMRLFGAEVRSFLDKMDVADLTQHIISGLVVDVNMQVRFSKTSDGATEPEITKAKTAVRTAADDADDDNDAPAED